MGLKESLHQIALDTAIYFGKPGWAQREARVLSGHDEIKARNIEADAYLRAAAGEANNGKHYRADGLRIHAIQVRPNSPQPKP